MTEYNSININTNIDFTPIKLLSSLKINTIKLRNVNKSEPYHIVALMNNYDSTHNIFNRSKRWYDRVYLCIEDGATDNCEPIKGFKCYRYYSYESIAIYRKHNNNINNVRKVVIPICRWIPNYFDKYYLDWHLRQIFWLGQNTIYHHK